MTSDDQPADLKSRAAEYEEAMKGAAIALAEHLPTIAESLDRVARSLTRGGAEVARTIAVDPMFAPPLFGAPPHLRAENARKAINPKPEEGGETPDGR